MKIFVTGGMGFVGKHACQELAGQGHEVVAADKAPGPGMALGEGYRYLCADTTLPGPWQEQAAQADAIINLAGANIFKRWNAAYKKQIQDTRVLTTRNTVEALPADWNGVFLSTSAGGYYGWRGNVILDESATPGKDFLATVCVEWEKEASLARQKGARVALMRFGVVLGKDGGALPQMARPFRLRMGGRLGDGLQWFPWIHVTDLISAMLFLLENPAASGPFNFTAPGALQNKDLTAALAKALRRPAILPAPGLALRAILGEFATVMLKGQHMVPSALVSLGFAFRFPDIASALADLLAT